MTIDPNDLDAAALRRDVDAIGRFTAVIRRATEHHAFLWDLASIIAELLELDDFVLYLREGNSLTQAAAAGIKAPAHGELLDPIAIPIGHAVVGRAAASKSTVHIPDLTQTDRYIADHVAGKSELTVPVVFEGDVVAVFDSEATQKASFADWQVRLMETFAAIAAPRIVLWRYRGDEHFKAEQARGRQARTLGSFAGTVAHDLNNILAVIELSAQLLRIDPNSPEQSLTGISQAVVRARDLTGRLLTLTANGPMNPDLIEVRGLLREASRAVPPTSDITVSIDVADDAPLIHADPHQLALVMTNLVTNAVESIGSEPGTVRLSARREGSNPSTIAITVEDSGPGVDDEIAERIFDPYYTTKPTGLGLGLASAHWTAQQHGGSLEVDTARSTGAAFTLRLPGRDGRIVESPPPLRPNRHLNVLVLEDDVLVGEGIEKILHHCGHDATWVMRCDDVVPAWQSARTSSEPFDVALLDIRNEFGEGGAAALRRLRQIDPNVATIAMSGYADEYLEQTLELGFTAHLAKPFQIAELDRALQDVVGDSLRSDAVGRPPDRC